MNPVAAGGVVAWLYPKTGSHSVTTRPPRLGQANEPLVLASDLEACQQAYKESCDITRGWIEANNALSQRCGDLEEEVKAQSQAAGHWMKEACRDHNDLIRATADLTAAQAEADRLRNALQRIERWFGEFPETGERWPSGEPISYGAQFGSNGERDYMRGIARAAIHAAKTEQERGE